MVGGLCLASLCARAVGFRLPNQDPEAIARGNAFVATADNPSAVYYNPAGITQLQGHNLRAGLYLVSGGVEYESPAGLEAEVNSDFQPVPQCYYVFTPPHGKWSVGLGAYAPYGLSVNWGDDSPFANLVQKGKVLFLAFNPVFAWKPHRTLSIAVGPTINYSDANLKQSLAATTGVPGSYFEFNGDGMGYGFNAGLLWQPHEKWSFGLNYRYQTEIEYEGTTQTNPSPPLPSPTPTHGPLMYPQYVVAGISFRPTDKWNLEFDVDWTDWDAVNEIVFNGTAFGNLSLPLNYRSGFMYEFGVTRQLGNGYFVSLGYFFSENSSPEKYFNPMVADADLHLGSIGLGHHGKRWDWAVAYHFGYNDERVVSGSIYPGADGRYHTLNHAFNIAVTFKF